MSNTAVADMVTSMEPTHHTEPILTQDSHTYGSVSVFAPNTDPSMWGELPWLLTTEHGADNEEDGLNELIRADKVWAAYQRPYFITDEHRF